MLALVPTSLYGRLGAVLSALIVIFSLIGLTIHKDFYAGKKRKGFFCFYTNLSNLLVLVYFSLVAPRLFSLSSLHALIPRMDFAVMMSIMLTFCVFHGMIYPSVRIAAEHAPHTREYRIVVCDNFIIHYLVPWLVFLYWLLCSPGKAALRAADALCWTAGPAVYLLVILLRARKGAMIEETRSPYPYPFLDAEHFGAAFVARSCALIYGVFVLAGFTLIALIHLLVFWFGDGHMLMLI
ncbi:MAG: Pr6Pr family membrane protein [Clostridia bacterium]|nr:Pr6Pr family membrane protein [Clostridia bacterium]